MSFKILKIFKKLINCLVNVLVLQTYLSHEMHNQDIDFFLFEASQALNLTADLSTL